MSISNLNKFDVRSLTYDKDASSSNRKDDRYGTNKLTITAEVLCR